MQHIVQRILQLLRNMTHVWETYIVFPGWRIGMQYFISLSKSFTLKTSLKILSQNEYTLVLMILYQTRHYFFFFFGYVANIWNSKFWSSDKHDLRQETLQKQYEVVKDYFLL